MHNVVVGVGNPLLGDDAVGIEVVKELKGKISADVKMAIAGGLELAEMIAGYNFALIIDAFYGEGIREIDVDKYRETVANHDISFPSAYRILSRYIKMPKVRIIGVGIEKTEIREGLSEKVRKSIPVAVEKVMEIMEEEDGYNIV
ncbi:MAG TPA: hydrogenase maturation protease [Thermoplasmatales archaeon]|nr:hydrogenase maturation protease [Thermoplasmatales archaeon]